MSSKAKGDLHKYSILDNENDDNDESILIDNNDKGFSSKDDNDTEDNTISLRREELIKGIEIDINNNDNDIENFNTQDDKKPDIDIDENSSILRRLFLLFQLSFPCCMSFLLSMMGGLINMMFAGHWCSDNRSNIFAAVSLSGLYTNITFLSLLIGMSSALETLASQYNGAGDYKNVGISYQRSCIVLFGMSIPVYFCWWYSELIFLSVGIDPNVCNIIGSYVRIRMFTIPLDCINESYRKFISSIGVMRPSLIANITFVTVLSTCNYTFRSLNYSYHSIAWSWVIAQYMAAIASVSTSLLYPEVRRCIQPLSCESFRIKEIIQFFKLGLPGTIMLCSEWWAYELLTISASFLGTHAVSAQTIILQISSLAFMIPLGLGVASCTLIGNCIGAGKEKLAANIAWLSIYTTLTVGILTCTLIQTCGPLFIDSMTTDSDVRNVAKKSILFLSMFVFIDGIQAISSGILRGVGRQELGAVTNVIAFYLIGLPLANVFSFKLKFGVPGLMFGMAFGTLTQAAVLLGLIWIREKQLFVAVDGIKNDKNKYDVVATRDIEMSDVDDKNTNDAIKSIEMSPNSVTSIHTRVENVLRESLVNEKEQELKELVASRKQILESQ